MSKAGLKGVVVGWAAMALLFCFFYFLGAWAALIIVLWGFSAVFYSMGEDA